jgi:plastocyanin
MTMPRRVAGLPALCAIGLAGMAYCHLKDVGAEFEEHVYYMAALFCGNIAASLALVPLVLVAGRWAPPFRLCIWVAAGTLAALTAVGFLWSRTFGLPQMADHIGSWNALGLASVGFEALVIAASVGSMLSLTHLGRADMVAPDHRIALSAPLWALTAGLLVPVAAVIVLHRPAASAGAGGCAGGAMACRAAPALRAIKRVSAAQPASGRSSIKTYTYTWGPIRTGDFATHWVDQRARHPHSNGFVIGLHARLIDQTTGQPVPIATAMLHHLYITHVRRGRQPSSCAGGVADVFYSTGEEDETLKLPPGYGYRLRADDPWRLTAMIMSHSVAPAKVVIEYSVTVDRDRGLAPVQPFWLRANGCSGHVAYAVPGGGSPGSRDIRTFHWRVPFTGRIVGASGHLHGGAEKMWLSQPRCHGRRLLDTNPRYGMPGDPMYHLNPVLHEPGPMDTRMFLSRSGIVVQRGETVDLHAAYDDHNPHWAVMAVMHVYVARAKVAPRGCRALPRDRQELETPGPARTIPPTVRIPLTRLNAHQLPETIHGALGPARRRRSWVVVDVTSAGFSSPHLSVPVGATLTWRFPEPIVHDASFANGPRAVGALAEEKGATTTVQLRIPGRYEFFCSLHPMTMHSVVDVRRGG